MQAQTRSPAPEIRPIRTTVAFERIAHLSSSVGSSFLLLMTNQMTGIAQPRPTTCARARIEGGSTHGRYSLGIGSDSVSPCQKMFTIHQRWPSNMSWKLLIPRVKGSPSASVRDSYVLNAWAI